MLTPKFRRFASYRRHSDGCMGGDRLRKLMCCKGRKAGRPPRGELGPSPTTRRKIVRGEFRRHPDENLAGEWKGVSRLVSILIKSTVDRSTVDRTPCSQRSFGCLKIPFSL